MNYFIADILNEEGITLFRQLSASKVRTLKAPIDGVRSYIIMLLPYRNPETERNVARFASFPDYHTAVTELLERVCKKLSQKFPGKTRAALDNCGKVCYNEGKKTAAGLSRRHGTPRRRQQRRSLWS